MFSLRRKIFSFRNMWQKENVTIIACHMRRTICPMFQQITIYGDNLSAIDLQIAMKRNYCHAYLPTAVELIWKIFPQITFKVFANDFVEPSAKNDRPSNYRLWHLWLDCGVTPKVLLLTIWKRKKERKRARKWERSVDTDWRTENEGWWRESVETDKYGRRAWTRSSHPARISLR